MFFFFDIFFTYINLFFCYNIGVYYFGCVILGVQAFFTNNMNIKIKTIVLLSIIFLFFMSTILAAIEEDRYKLIVFLLLNFSSGFVLFFFLLQYGFVPAGASIGYSRNLHGVLFILQIQQDYEGPIKTDVIMLNFFIAHLLFCLSITTVTAGVLNFLHLKFPQIRRKFSEIYNKFFD